MRKFDVPDTYRSGIIGKIKEIRKNLDPRKKNFEPGLLDFGELQLILPRHFGFCYGVENAIEISFRAIAENPGKKIYLLSEMIHNPAVNQDLLDQGIEFIMDTSGHQLIDWEKINSDDIVIVPAFGTTLEISNTLQDRGVEIQKYNTTCPFVEKVWKRSSEIGQQGFTTIIHGKYRHEETRATFSHSAANSAAMIIRDMSEAQQLAGFIRGNGTPAEFTEQFGGKFSAGFDPMRDLQRIGVVNQTTMLASETLAISEYLKQVMVDLHGDNYRDFFADTRDTLCYATNDNQDATLALSKIVAHIGIVIGGFNSSNTMQLATILSRTMPVFFIRGAEDILPGNAVHHFDINKHKETETRHWLPADRPLKVVITSGASCPDSEVEGVIIQLLDTISPTKTMDEAMHHFSILNASS